MFRPPSVPAPDTFVEAEFEASHRPRWDREEQALNAYEDVALHDLAPVPMAEEAWEVERSRMEAERDSNEETLGRYA